MPIRFALLVLAGAVTAWPQPVSRPVWKCNAKDGKFIVTPCGTCKKFYCWDGETFSETEGYTRPPAHVLRHFVKSKEDFDRSHAEMGERVHQGRLDAERSSAERVRQSQEFNETLRRKIADHAAVSPPSPRPPARFVPPAAAHPAMTAVGAVPAAPPPAPPIPAAKMAGISAGMDRAAVLAELGDPHGSLMIPDAEGGVEVLTYTLDAKSWAKVRLEKGRVVSVQKNE